MPDQWGRPTIQDWAGMTSAFAQIGANNRANKEYASKEKLKGETQSVYNALDSGGDVSALGVSTAGLTGGRALYAGDLKNKNIIAESKDRDELKTLTNGYLEKMAQSEDKVKFLESLNPTTINEQRAIAMITANAVNDKNIGLQLHKLSNDKGTILFKKFNDDLIAGRADMKNGNNEAAEIKLVTAIKDAHHPVFLEKNSDGTYDLHYREGNVDKLIGDNINLGQAYTKTLKITQPRFTGDYVAQRRMWAKKNNHSALNPEIWSNGQDTIQVSTVYNQDKPIDGIRIVYGQNGDRMDGGQGMSAEELRSLGFKPENLERDKKQAEISSIGALKDQRTSATAENKARTSFINTQRQALGDPNKKQYAITDKNGKVTVLRGTAEDAQAIAGIGSKIDLVDDLKEQRALNAPEKQPTISEINQTIKTHRQTMSGIIESYYDLDRLKQAANSGDQNALIALRQYGIARSEIKRLGTMRNSALGRQGSDDAGGDPKAYGGKSDGPKADPDSKNSGIVSVFNNMINDNTEKPIKSLENIDVSQLKSLSKTQGKDVYGRLMEYPASEDIITKIQKYAGQTQPVGEKFGQGPIESILGKSGIETSLAKQKEIVRKLKAMYPHASEKQIATAISNKLDDKTEKVPK